jgi:hypothetical protein
VIKYLVIVEKCLDIQLDDQNLIEVCRQAAEQAESHWRSMSRDDFFRCQIEHVLDHPFPSIPPRFVDSEDLEKIKATAEEKLGRPVIQIDGIRSDGLVNVLTE